MVELVDTRDLKSLDPERSCGFESRSRHNKFPIFMQKKHFILLSAATVMLLSSCSSKLGELSADNFTVTPNPLETQAGTVPATISGHFPEKYMNKKAVVTVIPELRYSNGQTVQGNSATFQGESVLGNDQTISYRLGGNYTMKTNFAYADDNKADIDAYQRISKQKQEANIKFLIQQATLRKSELANNSVQEFVRMLQKINADREGLNLENVEVSAYASPDGGFSINDKLANERQKVSEQYVNSELKKIKMDANVDAKYTAQDWEGFQELVKASDIQDKDVILRVLSMYKDPEEREQQIKNISSAFSELAEGILPQLRRSRLTINYETVGRSDDQILQQINADATKLSIEELLYGAALKDDLNAQEDIYKLATEIYPRDARAYNNLATILYARGNYDAARQYIQKAQSIAGTLPEAQANLGMLALKQGDLKTAEQLIAGATGANGLEEVLGNLHLAQGNYAQAEQDFAEIYSNSAALAQILNKNYASAAVTLKYVKNPDATTEYLKAILSARMGNNSDAIEALKNAIIKDRSLEKYAANDLELKAIQHLIK